MSAVVSTLTIDVIAGLWRSHAQCTWVSTGVNVMWSCGIWHPGPIHMQPTTRDRHMAALVITQVEADRGVPTSTRAALAPDRVEVARPYYSDQCTEAVVRKGDEEPCDKPAVALRIDPTEDRPYPVCAYHARGDMVPLGVVLAGGAS